MQYLFSFLFLVIFTSIYAQDINGGFEKWTPSGQPAPFNWESPTGWGTSNPRTEFIGAGVKKTNIRKSGTLAAELSTIDIFSELVPAVLSLGKLKIDFIEGKYIDDIFAGGINLDNKPSSIKFWYRYTSPEPDDKGIIRTFVKRYNNELKTSSIVYEDSLYLSLAGPYTEISASINFPDFNTQTDTFGILFMSGVKGEVKGASKLYVDDLEIAYISSTKNEISSDVVIYPNPIIDGNSFSVKGLKEEMLSSLKIYSLTGEEILFTYDYTDHESIRITLNERRKGLFIVKCIKGQFLSKIIIK